MIIKWGNVCFFFQSLSVSSYNYFITFIPKLSRYRVAQSNYSAMILQFPFAKYTSEIQTQDIATASSASTASLKVGLKTIRKLHFLFSFIRIVPFSKNDIISLSFLRP